MSPVTSSRPSSRPVAASDDAFLFELYASTRAEELAAWGWSAAQQELFLRMQWLAQKRGYEARYPSEGHCILELEGQPVGRLWMVRGEHELRLVDVTLLPAYRGSGLGSSVLRSLQEEAAGKPLRLHVLRNNPAAIGVAGASQPHNNMSPFLCVSFIIALEGIYPSRN